MTTPNPINFFNTHVAPEAIERVNEVLRSTFLNEGDAVRAFEQKLKDYLGTEHALALNSCTSALHVALMVLDVGPGDEVIVPPQTFCATALVVLHQRAMPVFADIDPRTGNLDAAAVAQQITRRTKAIIAVHWGGAPCDMAALQAVADRFGVPLIDDAAHAFGAEYGGAKIGSPSGSRTRMTCFSFQAIKSMTTGDGGLLCCRDAADAEKAARLKWFGIDKSKTKANAIGERFVDIAVAGYKYNMNNLAAALGLGNLVDYPARLERRRALDARYRRELEGVMGVQLLKPLAEARSSCWLFTLRVKRREEFGAAMKDRNIPVSVVDRRIDRHPVFGDGARDLPGMAEFDDEQIAIPLHDALTDADATRILDAVKAGW